MQASAHPHSRRSSAVAVQALREGRARVQTSKPVTTADAAAVLLQCKHIVG